MTNEMIERVARALFALENRAIDGWTWEKETAGTPELRDYWMESARAAIAAMREQSVYPICQRVIDRYPVMFGGDGIMREIWQAMIDEALK